VAKSVLHSTEAEESLVEKAILELDGSEASLILRQADQEFQKQMPAANAKTGRNSGPQKAQEDPTAAGLAVVVLLVLLAVIVYFRQSLADLLHRAMVSMFHLDLAHGVFWGALLVTFVASVMGKDQQQRLDQGKFGLAAGTSLGGLSGLIEKQPGLVVVGFVGSAVGGLLGWLFYLVLASLVVRFPQLKSLVVFQAGGLEELQKRLDVQSKQNLRIEFDAWREKFSRMISDAKSALVGRASNPDWEDEAVTVIRGWLTSAVDTLALVFGTLADRPQYQSRVTIIVYRVSDAGGNPQAKGMHWISYAGQLKPHLKDHLFDETSVGYKVLKQELESPYFTTKEIAEKEGQTRAGDPSYRPFITFRLNESAILALDWPEELKKDDHYVEAARSLFYSAVTPAITEVLSHWPKALDDAAGVPQLQANAPQSAAKAALVPAPAPPVVPAAPANPPAVVPGSAGERPAAEDNVPNDKADS
jgi:hypothetical protein